MSFDEEWARCAPWLEAALARDGGHSLEEARAEAISGASLFWPGRRSAAITEMTRGLHVWAAGGDLGELLEMEAAASAWARANGFDRMSLTGRKGWDRVLAARGYRLAPRTLLREL